MNKIYLIFGNGSTAFLGSGTKEKCDHIMADFLYGMAYKPSYWRAWESAKDETMIDFGSHTVFFKIVKCADTESPATSDIITQGHEI